jgi:phosphohistidine phosphatase
MDLILWRHAEAEDGLDDERRRLTAKGRRQADAMAKWLHAHLPRHHAVIVSPALRTRETAAALTAAALTAEVLISDEVGLGASPASILRAAGWPDADRPVVIVGHQPTLGMTAAELLTGRRAHWSVRKGSICWIARKGSENTLRAVLPPELV